jgi:hypothetical protein
MKKTLFTLPLQLLLLCALCVAASAQSDLGPQNGASKTTSSSQLNLSANAVRGIQLDISSAPGGVTVTGATGRSSTGVFALDFGDVDGLGLVTPAPGVSASVSASGATYTTPVHLTPIFSGFSSGTASVSVLLDPTAGTAAGRAAAREGSGANSVVNPSSTATVFTSSAASGTTLTRYVGVFVSNANGAGAVSGSLASRLIYQVVVP